jgi:hypothetical protein
MIGQIRPDIKKEDLMQPEEIAELVLYLVTHEGNAAYSTGGVGAMVLIAA